jgi:hypothetical protein
MSRFTVVFDANIFYPAPLRDLMLRLAATGLFRARWTEQIHDEWMRNLGAKRPDIVDRLPKLRQQIDTSFLDSLVTGYEHFIPCVTLPDTDDRHVVAAAIKAGAGLIVTCNLKHFPDAALAQFGLEAIHPDDFFVDIFDLHAGKVLGAVAEMRSALKNPPKTQEEFLQTLLQQQLPQTVSILEKYKAAF